MNAQIVSIVIFFAVIIAIISEKIHRTVAALTGMILLLLFHILDIDKAISYIDFNTIGVLLGMMIFVSVVKQSGLFEYVAIKSAKLAQGDPLRIMLAFMILTAVLSAFLDNVTTVLLIGPMTITICQILKINPVPMLMTQILASNIGGTGTLIGDPPNIMIGSAAGLDFTDFLLHTGLVVLVILFFTAIIMRVLYKKDLVANQEEIQEILSLDEKKAIEDPALLRKSLLMLPLVVLGFVFHGTLGIESAVVALTAGVVMLLIGKQNAEHIIMETEWATILFFLGLFVVVGGMVETGVISKLAQTIIELTKGNEMLTIMVLLWGSALLSSILDNIPFVATLIPMITAMGASGINVEPFWWAISLGACLGGNGTLIGASANVVLSGIAGKHGHPISFKDYTKIGFPVMIFTIVIATVYLAIKY